MSNRFIISDPHYGHDNIRFIPGRREICGNMTPVEHDEFLIDNWNGAVGKRDTVYLLGDLGWDKHGYVSHGVAPRLKGQIIVIGGNHDTAEILQAFATNGKVNGVITMSIAGYRCVLTHIPIHPQEMYWDYNIHGHLHGNTVKEFAHTKDMGKIGPDDKRYINVCCEHMNFTPQPLEEVVLTRSGRTERVKRKNR